MRNRSNRVHLRGILFLFLLLSSIGVASLSVHASEVSTGEESPETSQKVFEMIVDDAADLLTEDEEAEVLRVMKRLSHVCNLAMLTRSEGEGTAKEYTDAFAKEHWKSEESIIFSIDYVEGVIRCGHYADDEEKVVLLEDADYKKITDEIIGDVNDENYGKACKDFFKKLSVAILGESAKTIEETSQEGYEIIVDDQSGLLTEEEQEDLLQVMEPIAAYGHVVFLTTDHNEGSAREYCRSYFEKRWDKDSALILLIDMDNHVIRLESFGYGQLYDMITEAYSNTITDNVYKYAGEKDYNKCATEAFTQVNQVLEGKRIAQPMKYICNALLALISSIILIFVYVRTKIVQKAPSSNEMLDYINYHCDINKLSKQYLRKERNHVKSSSSGSSSGSDSFWSGSSGSSSSGSSWGGSSGSSSSGSSSSRSHGGEHRF